MCWCGKLEDKKVATEDIKVKKVVERLKDGYYAYYQEWFEYKLGEVYETTVEPRVHKFIEGVYLIDNGFHSYAWDMEMKSQCGGDILVKSTRPNCGQTIFNNFGKYDQSHKVVVMECTIPKGTAYWENATGEIVSEKLIVEEEIYIEDDCNFC